MKGNEGLNRISILNFLRYKDFSKRNLPHLFSNKTSKYIYTKTTTYISYKTTTNTSYKKEMSEQNAKQIFLFR